MPRRLALLPVVLLLAVALGLALPRPAVRAQSGTPVATPAGMADLPPVVRQWLTGMLAFDSKGVAALYTDNGVYEDVPAGMTAHGQDEIMQFLGFMGTQQKDLTIEQLRPHVAGDLVVVEYVIGSTDIASGTRITNRGATIFELEGGKIRRSADYYDVASILMQLGVLQMPMEGTPTP